MLVTLATLSLALAVNVRPTALSTTQSAEASADSTAGSANSTTVPRRSAAHVGFESRESARESRRRSSDTTTAQRRRAVEHSDWYYRRLTIHKVASYATVPLFATEWYLGNKLFDGEGTSTERSAHQAVASGIGVLFGVNTVTGVWNLWDSRNDSQGRARRMTHAVLMLASDAGFVATASLAPEGDDLDEGGSDNRARHRTVALASMGVSAVSYLMMYLWK